MNKDIEQIQAIVEKESVFIEKLTTDRLGNCRAEIYGGTIARGNSGQWSCIVGRCPGSGQNSFGKNIV